MDLPIPERTTHQIESQPEHNWWLIGFKFGIGLGAALWLYVLADRVMQYEIAKYQIRLAFGEVNKQIGQFTPPALPNMHTPQLHQVHVPPGDKDTCMQKSGGVINDVYKTCITGYSYWATD